MDTLKDLRTKIDAIDKNIVNLLIERMTLAVNVAEVKKSINLEIFAPKRENEVINRALMIASKTIPEKQLVNIFKNIIAASTLIQKSI